MPVPLVTAQQYRLSPDILGGIQQGVQTAGQIQGLQQASQASDTNAQIRQLTGQAMQGDQEAFKQLAAISPQTAQQVQGIQQKQTTGLDARQQSILKSASQAAVTIQTLPSNESKLTALLRRKSELEKNNIPTDETQEVIDLFESGQVDAANTLLDKTILAGEKLGFVKTTETLDIQREKLDLRKDELEARNLERLQKEETNALRREEIGLKLEQKRTKIRQDKQKVQSDAKAKIQQQGALSTSIDDFLKNDDYVNAVTGVRGRTPAITTTGIEAEAFFDNIKNNLTLENLDKMTGVLSETDIKILSTAATALNKGTSKSAMTKEMRKIQSVLKDKSADVQSRLLGVQPAQTSPQAAPAPQQPDSQILRFDAQGNLIQ